MEAKKAEVPKSILWLALSLNSYVPKALDLEWE